MLQDDVKVDFAFLLVKNEVQVNYVFSFSKVTNTVFKKI